MDKNVFGIQQQCVPQEVSKKIHPVKVPGCHTMTNYELGQKIIGMRYDQVCEVLRGMLDALHEEIKGDAERNRMKLVKCLSNALIYLELVLVYFEKAFRVCRPYMDHELNRGKRLAPPNGEEKK